MKENSDKAKEEKLENTHKKKPGGTGVGGLKIYKTKRREGLCDVRGAWVHTGESAIRVPWNPKE